MRNDLQLAGVMDPDMEVWIEAGPGVFWQYKLVKESVIDENSKEKLYDKIYIRICCEFLQSL